MSNQPHKNNSSKKIADYAELGFASLAKFLINYRWPVLFATMSLMAWSVLGITKVRVDSSISNIFTPSDPSFVAYTSYLDEFDSDEICYILYGGQTKNGVFDIEIMQSIAELTEVLEQEVPFVDEAKSLSNIEFIRAVGEDDIEIDDLMVNFPETQRELSALREEVLAKPNYKNLVISKDGRYAAIALQMSVSRLDPLESLKLDPDGTTFSSNVYPNASFLKVKEILQRPEYRHIPFYLTGDVSINSERNRMITRNNAIVVLCALGVVLLLSIYFFNATLIGVLAPLLVVLSSILVCVGFMGWQGWAVGIFFGMVPTLLCAIGVAQSVHILIDYQRHFVDTHDPNEAIQTAIQKVGGPCLLAAMTTAAGFLAMSISEMQSMREMAVYAALGVMATFVLSIVLMAIIMSRKDGANRKAMENLYTNFTVHGSVNTWIESVIRTNLAHHNWVLLAGAAIFIFSLVGMTKLKIQVELIEDFKPSVEVRQDTEFVESHMSGNASLVYLVDAQEADGIKDPAFLAKLEAFQEYALGIDLVRDARSINNILKELNQSFNADDPEMFRLPQARDLIAQYLLVYEFSGGVQLADFVTQDYSKAALKLRLAMASSQEIAAVVDQLDQYLEENPITAVKPQVTGMGLLWVKIGEYIINTQISSYLLVFLMIAIVVSLVFGSIKVGAVAMVPNLGPIFICMGAMGWMNVPLDHYKIMLGAIALGIAVDDTLHLITRYRSRFLSTGQYDKAMARSLRDVGPALIITTMILVGAFSMYGLSEMQTLSSFGYLLASAIILALLSDLYLAPCLIKQVKLFGPEFEGEVEDVEQIFDRFDADREERHERLAAQE